MLAVSAKGLTVCHAGLSISADDSKGYLAHYDKKRWLHDKIYVTALDEKWLDGCIALPRLSSK